MFRNIKTETISVGLSELKVVSNINAFGDHCKVEILGYFDEQRLALSGTTPYYTAGSVIYRTVVSKRVTAEWEPIADLFLAGNEIVTYPELLTLEQAMMSTGFVGSPIADRTAAIILECAYQQCVGAEYNEAADAFLKLGLVTSQGTETISAKDNGDKAIPNTRINHSFIVRENSIGYVRHIRQTQKTAHVRETEMLPNGWRFGDTCEKPVEQLNRLLEAGWVTIDTTKVSDESSVDVTVARFAVQLALAAKGEVVAYSTAPAADLTDCVPLSGPLLTAWNGLSVELKTNPHKLMTEVVKLGAPSYIIGVGPYDVIYCKNITIYLSHLVN